MTPRTNQKLIFDDFPKKIKSSKLDFLIRNKKEVFFKPEFKSWASKNLILVELDFPKRKKLEPELQKQNQQLAQMFQVRGYPSGWFVIPEISEGKTNFNRLGSQGYVRGGVNAWIEGAKNILNKK